MKAKILLMMKIIEKQISILKVYLREERAMQYQLYFNILMLWMNEVRRYLVKMLLIPRIPNKINFSIY